MGFQTGNGSYLRKDRSKIPWSTYLPLITQMGFQTKSTAKKICQ
jgi:hypothetical protein